MPIDPSEIEYRLSGGATNTDPNASLGGAMSTDPGGLITSGVLNNLFDDVTGDEAASGDVEYRCIYIRQVNGTLTLSNTRIWINVETPSTDTEVAIALADEGKNGTAETIADESTAPVGPVFTRPLDKASGLDLTNLGPSEFYAVWIRRTVSAAAAAFNNDGPTLRVEGDTPA